MRCLASLLTLALAAAALPARADLVLDVKPGDTPADVLMRHSKEVREAAGHGLDHTSRRRFAYRLLLRSPKVANARIHPGDQIVVGRTGKLQLIPSGRRFQLTGPPAPPPLVGPPAPGDLPDAYAEAPRPGTSTFVGPLPLPAEIIAQPGSPGFVGPLPLPSEVAEVPHEIAPPAPPEPPPPPPVAVSPDGRTATIHGETLQAGPGLAFFERAGELHVIATAGTAFDLAVPIPASGTLEIPPNPYARLTKDRVLLPAGLPDGPQDLVARGELNVHDDHLHLTAKFPHPAWQKLYAARLDDSPYDALRRQSAAILIVKLLDVHVEPSPDRFPGSLAHVLGLVDRTWRTFEEGVAARDIAEMLDRDFEVFPDGHRVEIAGHTFVTASPLRFETCSGHFHVLGDDDEHRFSVRVPLDGNAFSFPESPFFAVSGNVVVPKTPMARWMELVRSGQLEQRRGHYHLTTKWDEPALQQLVSLAQRGARPEIRDAAGSAVLQLLGSPLEPRSEDDLLASLTETAKLAQAAREAIEKRAKDNGWPLDLAAAQ